MHLEFIMNIIDLIIVNVFYKVFLRTERRVRRGTFFIINTLLAVVLFLLDGRNGIWNGLLCDTLIIAIVPVMYRGANRIKLLAALLCAAICFTLKTWAVCLPDTWLSIIPEAVKILMLLLLIKLRYDIRDFQGKEYAAISGFLISLIAGGIAFAAAPAELAMPAVLTVVMLCSIYAVNVTGQLIEAQNCYKISLLDNAYKEKYYSVLKKNQLRLEKIRHSYKRQLQGVLEQAKENPAEGIKLLEELLGKAGSGEGELYTPNYIVNDICREKFPIARENAIAIKYALHIPEALNINAADMASVYGNILDDAVEACGFAEAERRKIDFYTSYKDNKLYIRFRYPYTEETSLPPGSGNRYSGSRLAVVEETVKKQEGIMNVEIQDQAIEIKIVIYCGSI